MAPLGDAVNLRGFNSINTREDAGSIEEHELAECKNFDIGRSGEVTKRTGIIQLHNGETLVGTVTLLGHFLTDTYSQLIGKVGTTIYYSTDGITWSVLLASAGTAEWGVQYGVKFYIIRRSSTIVEWTGTTATAITGSPSGTFGFIFKDRLFVLNARAAGTLNSRLYFSTAGDLTATGWPSTNWIDINPGDGDFLVTINTLADILFLFKGKSTWALYADGSPSGWSLRNVNNEIGCLSKYACRIIEGYIYFASTNSVYRTDGNSFDDIALSINKDLEARVVNLTMLDLDSFAYWEGKLICRLAFTTSDIRYFVHYIAAEGWSQWEFAGGDLPSSFIEVRTTTPISGVYMGGASKVFRYGDEVYTDVGATYQCSLKTKQFDFDQPMSMKRGKWGSIDAKGVATLNYSHIVDNVSSVVRSRESIVTRSLAKLHGPGYFRTWQFHMYFSNTVPFTLFGISLFMAPKRTVIKTRT